MSSTHEGSTLITETEAPTDRLDRDDVFHILQCRRRRLVLKYLQEHDGPADMRDVTEAIAAVENDTTVAQLRSQERQRVYIALYQSHLPKMDRDGIINYEQDRGVVERTARTAQFDPYLVNEPTLLPESETTDEGPVDDGPVNEGPADQGPVDQNRDDASSASDTAGGWNQPSLVAAGGGLALVASVYAATTLAGPAALVAVAVGALVAVLAGVYYYRESIVEAGA
ncbi:hypothetical protein SAMN05216559_0555 [Halomicrobium zhouii]|uniref:DUF7344 domain-containing protein n=1 Tax=Halomicrobium zhouii TaxID=767519 RepID=A0A1I6KCH3_9EURY|nr:hypothetical protein [Halomicrobium zhouii]SFR88942.1 hypothetical protein SAMN05216559_0555 [Halomicrobium zhouii]